MDTWIIVPIAAGAVWYLVRRFTKSIRSEHPSCGCGGCDGCPAAADTRQADPTPKREK